MNAIAIQSLPPRLCEQERPANYADRIGRSYASVTSQAHKRDLGQYFTPIGVTDFMARLCQTNAASVRALDPGAGAGVLSCALCEALASQRKPPKEISLVAFESDQRLVGYLEASLAYTKRWLVARGIELKFEIRIDDFVLTQAGVLDESPMLFQTEDASEADFDLVIANPPYFKLPKSDSRARAAAAVVHGQPNIYALFMAISAALLKRGGQMVCITPRSYTAGPYFQLFRNRFFALMQPRAIHLFGSRHEAFGRDEVLQENLILLARRADGWLAQNSEASVKISFSQGAHDISKANSRKVPLAEILDPRSQDKVLRIPLLDEDDQTARLVRSWPGNLHAYGIEISTGPVVPFRAVPLLCQNGRINKTHAPLLWMQNVTMMQVQWPVESRGKEQYIVVNEQSKPLLVPNRNYVLLRRFSAKEARRRLVAAPFLSVQFDSPYIGLENHLNYVHRPGGSLSEAEAYGLAALLNGALLDTYFRTINGNTQVSATELRSMPLPPIEIIRNIGQRVAASHHALTEIDTLVEEVLGANGSDGNRGETDGED